eukprot:Em0007g806a
MSSHIDEKRYSVLVDYLTSCKEGDLRDSRVYPVGATANEKRRIRQQAAMFVLKERLLYYRATDTVNEICLKRVIANVKERTKIIRACHDGVDGCHYGRDKTRAKIGQTYWWKGLNRDVDQYCRRCDVCQRVNAKLEGKKAELHPIPVPSKVWSQIGIDLIGPLPETCRKNKYIVTVTDYFSKWPEGAPLKDKTAVGVADFLFTVFCRHGWPDIIISDQGREFVNKLSSCLFKLTGIEHRISSPYHPQTNGLDERTNQTLTRALIKFSEAKENWDESIDAALYAYRIAKQDSSQFSPFFIMYNRNPRMAIDHEFSCKATTNVTGENTCTYDMEETYGNLVAIREKYHQKVLKNIERAQQRQKAQYNAKRDTLHIMMTIMMTLVMVMIVIVMMSVKIMVILIMVPAHAVKLNLCKKGRVVIGTVEKHCNTMNIYFMSSYIHHNFCAYCDQGQIDCAIEQRKMKSLIGNHLDYIMMNMHSAKTQQFQFGLISENFMEKNH